MKFNDNVVLFHFCDFPMVGNLNNGYAIGLDDAGAALCTRLSEENVVIGEIADIDQALADHLLKGGFFEDAEDQDGYSHSLKAAYLHVTQRCNLNCAGCYSYDEGRNSLPDASLDDIEHALDELSSAGLSKLIISGGEPFLRDDLADIIKYAKDDCGIQNVTVLSNGTCIRKEMLDSMSPYVDCVSVSFDGCSADSVPSMAGLIDSIPVEFV